MRILSLILMASSVLAASAGLAQERPGTTVSGPLALPGQSWIKHCQTPTTTGAVRPKTCVTYRERVEGDTDVALVTVAIRQTGGQQGLMVSVPVGVERAPGVRVRIYPGNLWEKVQKAEQLDKGDEDRLTVVHLKYGLCREKTCTADVAANPKLISDLKSNAGLIVFAVKNGQSIAYPIPLRGFREAYDGPPVDIARIRNELIGKIRERLKQLKQTSPSGVGDGGI